MNLDDILAMKKYCDDSVQKLQQNLNSYQLEVEQVNEVLRERWSNVQRVDGRLIALHNQLLSSLSDVNANVIKLNLHIKLNRPAGLLREGDKSEELPPSIDCGKPSKNKAIKEASSVCDKTDKQALKQLQDMDESNQRVPIDLTSKVETLKQPVATSLIDTSSWLIELFSEELKPKPMSVRADPETDPPARIYKLPLPPRKRNLLPPKGGRQTSSDEIYELISKNTLAFPETEVVTGTVMHLNIADDCCFVAKWGPSSKPVQQLLQGKVPLLEVDQIPDYGEIFAVYDSTGEILPRIAVNAAAEGGGYDAYLIDYGEHIHLFGYETIFLLPEKIKELPAQAVKCHFTNHAVEHMRQFIYKNVQLRVYQNNGIDLIVGLEESNDGTNTIKSESQPPENSEAEQIDIEEPTSDLVKELEHVAVCDNQPKTDCPEGDSQPLKLSEEAMAILNEIEMSTSDPLKAVLGYRPMDDQRICRHYDPKLNGCFKGNNCRLMHEPSAPPGVTKDVEVVGALPETVFDTPLADKLGSNMRILITFINSPTNVYVQFVDGSPPLVWDKSDVPEEQRRFKKLPHILDIVRSLYCDNCFYRAQIIEEMDGKYKVFYVDYGNTEFVPLDSLAPIADVDALHPHRAVSCHIEGVIRSSLLTHQKNVEGVEYLKSRLLNNELDVKLEQRLPDGFAIRLQDEYADVPEQLVKRGYAQPSGEKECHKGNGLNASDI
ncbi:hypothetical protein KR009_003120 [Drosophila setifemur]|nr:hypothetical protein KR009_003120 [Drosophila setifemur]